jgi:hypothetical protein
MFETSPRIWSMAKLMESAMAPGEVLRDRGVNGQVTFGQIGDLVEELQNGGLIALVLRSLLGELLARIADHDHGDEATSTMPPTREPAAPCCWRPRADVSSDQAMPAMVAASSSIMNTSNGDNFPDFISL